MLAGTLPKLSFKLLGHIHHGCSLLRDPHLDPALMGERRKADPDDRLLTKLLTKTRKHHIMQRQHKPLIAAQIIRPQTPFPFFPFSLSPLFPFSLVPLFPFSLDPDKAQRSDHAGQIIANIRQLEPPTGRELLVKLVRDRIDQGNGQ